MKKIILVSITAFALNFTALANAQDSAQEVIPLSSPEVLLGLTTNDLGINIQVKSGGCTGKGSFDIIVMESHPAQILVLRKSPVMCRMYMPHGKVLSFTYEELGLRNTTFTVINKIDRGVVHTSDVSIF